MADKKYPTSWSMDEYFRIWQYGGHEQAREYAGKHLKKLGCGEGRCAFKLDDTKILKIAKDVKMGVRQNSFEIENVFNNEENQLTPEIYEFDDKYSRWIEMEYITPFKDDEDFMEVMGFLPYEAEDVFDYLYGMNKGDLDAFDYETQDSIEYLLADNDYIRDFIELARGSNMAKSTILPDFMRADHWGVNKRGEPKIMDLGFTYEYARFR